MPTTLEQWLSWVDNVPQAELWSKTITANSMPFVTRMQQEGWSLGDIEQIVTRLAHRLVAAQLPVPQGGAFDLQEKVQQSPWMPPGGP